MRIHFIGIVERIMGDLAAALQTQGHMITSSEKADLAGQAIDQVIVGRQVPADHPVLQAAQQQGLPISSYAEFIYTYAQDKQRIVVVGKEKTLICLLVLHVLRQLHKTFDYIVDTPQLPTSVQLSNAPVIILEGDAAPSSPIDLQPQSLRYQHHILLLSSLDWEANGTYPTIESYLQYITRLADTSPKSGSIIYSEEDKLVKNIATEPRADVKAEAYPAHPHRQVGEQVYLLTPQGELPFPAAALAAMQAVAAAQQLVRNLAITDQQFYEALATFPTHQLS